MWSIRSTIVGERRCRLVREGKNDGVVRWASRTSTPAIPTSTTSRTSVAAAVVRLKKCPPARQLLMENSLLIMPPLAWPSSAAAPRSSADLEQQKREQCRERVCERSDGKPLDTAELSAPASEFDTAKPRDGFYLTHCKAKFPSLAGRAASGGRVPPILLQTLPARHTAQFIIR